MRLQVCLKFNFKVNILLPQLRLPFTPKSQRHAKNCLLRFSPGKQNTTILYKKNQNYFVFKEIVLIKVDTKKEHFQL